MYMSTNTGIGGEDMSFSKDKPEVNFRATYYILRPEAVETLYYLNQITGDPIYRYFICWFISLYIENGVGRCGEILKNIVELDMVMDIFVM